MYLYPMIKLLIDDNPAPPTLYSLMNSIVNYDADTQIKIESLAESARSKIFNFSYPFYSNTEKESFEVQILNHFIMRRIGYETYTAWHIALNVKMNEIMPKYNPLLKALSNWKIFEDGETESRYVNSIIETEANSENISDRRYSDTPQNSIDDVQSGEYVSDYNFDTDKSNSTGNNTSISNEDITRTPADKIRIYKEYIQEKNSIMTLIYQDLDSLFYGLSDF